MLKRVYRTGHELRSNAACAELPFKFLTLHTIILKMSGSYRSIISLMSSNMLLIYLKYLNTEHNTQ